MAVGLPRPPALVISGINYGENMGTGVTTSGTIGAAIEAACWGVPALAVSLETDPAFHYSHSPDVEFQVAAGVTRRLAKRLLAHGLPEEVDLLKVDIPSDATDATPWRLTRISRQRYYYPVPSQRRPGAKGETMGYESRIHPDVEDDSDINVLARRREISIAPMTIDLTAHGQYQALERLLAPEDVELEAE
jgi:5'-nucleotidase